MLSNASEPTEAGSGRSRADTACTDAAFTPVRLGLVLLVILAVAFPGVILGTRVLVYRDAGVLAYPFAWFQQASFWRGELPLWNPLSHCGVPFLAQWGTNLYPLALIYLLGPLPWSLGYFNLAHLVLAGLGMHWLARQWVGSRFAATVAGVAYVVSGVMFSCHIWPNYVAALGWMPWVVGGVQRGWREGGRWLVFGAGLGGLQMLCGVPELILFTWVVLGVLWLGDLRTPGPARAGMAARFPGMVLLVAGLAAVQLLPFVDLLWHSQRDTGFGTSKWAMPLWGWGNLLVPLLHYAQTPQGPWFQTGQEFLTSYYLGAGVLVLAVWAVCRVRCRQVGLLAGLAGLGLILALGERGWVFGWIREAIPLVGVARYPIKFVLLTAFAAPLLAAWAVRELQTRQPAAAGLRGLRIVGGVALGGMAAILWAARQYPMEYDRWDTTAWNALGRAGLLAATLALAPLLARPVRPRRRMLAHAGLLAVLAIDGLTHVPLPAPTLPVSALAPGLWQRDADLPPPRHGQSRALITPEAERRLLHSGVRDPLADYLGKRLAEWSNLNLLDQVPKVNGAATLQLREQKQVEQLIYGPTHRASAGLLDFLAVSHVSSPDNPAAWVLRTNPGDSALATCGQQPVFANADDTLQALTVGEFNPRRVVYLPPEARPAISVTHPTRCAIVASNYSFQRLDLEVVAEEASLVVIAQTHYHPWQATVDGQRAPLWRANHAFQALEVPAGRHRVRLVYRDVRLLQGGLLTALTLVVCAALGWRSRSAPS
ncbi:MAG: hypothetical protein JXQ71_07760 [Verrucomicrobia bacterium]|nr:hypothetical protein [Verrucomicrobiota bacterium]